MIEKELIVDCNSIQCNADLCVDFNITYKDVDVSRIVSKMVLTLVDEVPSRKYNKIEKKLIKLAK